MGTLTGREQASEDYIASLVTFNADPNATSMFYSEDTMTRNPVRASDVNYDLDMFAYQLNEIDGTSNEKLFRHLLLKYPLNILGTAAEGMLDSGASDNFMSTSRSNFLHARFGLRKTRLANPTSAKLANGGTISCTHKIHDVPIQLGEYHFLADFKVLNMKGLDVVLGKPWLTDVNPIIDFKSNSLCIRTPTGDHVINPNLMYSHVDHQELNIMHLNTFLTMQSERPNTPTMIFSLHEIGTDVPQEHVNDIQTENIMHNGNTYQLWIHDVSLLSAETMPPPLSTSNMGCTSDESAMSDVVTELPVEVGDKPPGLNSLAVPGKPPQITPEEKALKTWIETHPARVADNQDFDEHSQQSVQQLVKKYINVHIPHEFTPPGQKVKGINYRHRIIELPDSTPKMQQPYRLSPTEMIALKEWIDNMLKRGFIRPSSSPYGAPVMFAPKPDGTLRAVVDFRRLNAQTVKDSYPLPRARDLFDQMKDAKYFTSFDMLDGYYNVLMHEDSIEKTCIRTPLGSYEFLVLPMGLCNSPSSFARLVEIAFRDLHHKGVLTYIDDIIAYSKTKEEHIILLDKIFSILQEYNFRLKPSKCSYFMTKVKFLGHYISEEGLSPDPKKVEAISKWPELKSVEEVQQFMGLVNYYRDHIDHFAEKVKALTDIQSNALKDDDWTTLWKEPQKKAFELCKTLLTSAPILALPDMNKPFILQTDASGFAIGGALMQEHKGKRRVVAYMSKKLSPTESKWCPYEREMFAIFHACKTWRHYIAGSELSVESDHKPLIWLKTQKTLSRKQANWMTFLEEFKFAINYLPGKQMEVGDPLSRRPDHNNYIKQLRTEFDLNYIARGQNRGRWVLNPSIFAQLEQQLGTFDLDACADPKTAQTENATDNIYQTTLAGKHSYINGPFDTVSLNCIIGYYYKQKALDPQNTSACFILPMWTQKPWYTKVAEQMTMVSKIKAGTPNVFYLPSDRYYGKKDENTPSLIDVGPLPWDLGIFYDAPGNTTPPVPARHSVGSLNEYLLHYVAASDLDLTVEDQQPQTVVQDEEYIAECDDDYFNVLEDESDDYFNPVLDDEPEDHLSKTLDKLPDHIVNQQSTSVGDLTVFADWIHRLRQAYDNDSFVSRLKTGEKIQHFHVSNNLVYYGDNPDNPADRKLYIPAAATELQNDIISEFHDTPIAGHLSEKKTLERLQRYFYWPNMMASATQFIKSCDTCRRMKRRTFARPSDPVPYPIPEYPWQIMALDMKSGVPSTPRGNNAFWVFVDKLTRRGHAIPCSTNITAPELARMFFDHVFKHHGIPQVLISDRDTRYGLNRESFWRELWSIIGTKLNMSTANRPQTDGLAERYIGTLSAMLRSFAHQNPHDWDLYISAIEFAYNDSVHPATGFTPFQLDMGRDPHVPIQMLLQGVINRPSIYHQSEGLIDPTVYLTKYTSMMNKAKSHMSRKQYLQHQKLLERGTVPIVYETGDYVYVEHPLTTHGTLPTLTERYEGPFRVVRRESRNAYRLDFRDQNDHRGVSRSPVVNVDKLIPYVDRETGETRPKDITNPNPGIPDEHIAQSVTPPPQVPPTVTPDVTPEITTPTDTDPPTPEQVITDTLVPQDYPFQSKLGPGTTITGITAHRVREVNESITEASVTKVHRILQAELLVRLNYPRKGTKIKWIPVNAIIGPYRSNVDTAARWEIVDEYLQQHPEASQLQHPIFAPGTLTDDANNKHSGYVISKDLDDTTNLAYNLVRKDGDRSDWSNDEIQKFVTHQLVDLSVLDYIHRSRQHHTVSRILILCSGTDHDKQNYKRLFPHAQIDTLDNSAKHGNPTFLENILNWNYKQHPSGYYDIIHASPPCTYFSYANPHPHVRNVYEAVSIVLRCLTIIRYHNPLVWILENPVNRLQHSRIMVPYEQYKKTTTYCMFGTQYKKATNLWTNINVLMPRCCADTPCQHVYATGSHPCTAQAGPSYRKHGTQIVLGTPSHEVQKMPFTCLKHMMNNVPCIQLSSKQMI